MSKILKGLNESTHNKYDNNRTGFSRGPRDDERHDLDAQKPAREEWALKINGKVWSKDGKTVTFDSKERALKARQSLLAKRPELEVGLVTRSVSEEQLDELSNNKLGQYKTAAALDAGKADKQGDYERGDKRMSGIIKATKKQFDNDTKKSSMDEAGENSLDPFKYVNPRVNNPKILGTQNKAKSAYYPPSKPPVKKLDKPLPENVDVNMSSKSFDELVKDKSAIERQIEADGEAYKQDLFKNNASRQPKQNTKPFQPIPVIKPGEGPDVLKDRLKNLDITKRKFEELNELIVAIRKTYQHHIVTTKMDELDQRLLQDVKAGPIDNYKSLFVKLSKLKTDLAGLYPTAVEYLANRNKQGVDEDNNSGRMRMNDYYDQADAIQEKLRHAIQMGDKARIQELNKQRDELDAHVKKHGMMPEDVSEEKQRLDPKCWKGYKKQGTKMKGDTRVNNCVPVKESSIMQGINHLDEGWKEKLGAAALTGALALGSAGAQARVTPDGQGNFTGGMKPTATVQSEPAPATPSTATIPGQGLVRAERADRQAGTVTVNGQEYKMIMLEPGGIRPRGGQQIVIPQSVMGERGIGNYMAILAGGRVFVLPKNE